MTNLYKWDGEGQPPIGLKCQVKDDGTWCDTEIVGYHNNYPIFTTPFDERCSYDGGTSYKFRPHPLLSYDWNQGNFDEKRDGGLSVHGLSRFGHVNAIEIYGCSETVLEEQVEALLDLIKKEQRR